MGYRAEQIIFNWGLSNDWEAPKEMFNILSIREIQIKTTLKVHLTPSRMAKIKISEDSVDKNLEKEKHSSIDYEIVSLYNHSGNKFGDSSENWA